MKGNPRGPGKIKGVTEIREREGQNTVTDTATTPADRVQGYLTPRRNSALQWVRGRGAVREETPKWAPTKEVGFLRDQYRTPRLDGTKEVFTEVKRKHRPHEDTRVLTPDRNEEEGQTPRRHSCLSPDRRKRGKW